MGHSVLPKSVSEERIKQNLDVYDWSIPGYLLAKFSEIKQVSHAILHWYLCSTFSCVVSAALLYRMGANLFYREKKYTDVGYQIRNLYRINWGSKTFI